jgi:hypothetical protein
MANTKMQTQEGSKQNTRFVYGKTHTPPETKAIKTSVKFNQLPMKWRTQGFIN